MIITKAQSLRADSAYLLVCDLQSRFVNGLDKISQQFGQGCCFTPIEWLRDEGLHGGGVRFMASDNTLFNRGSVNISQVHYDDDQSKKLASATAISTIIHPDNPLAPSVHIHISWTEMKEGSGYWRLMADLNPSNEFDTDKERFAGQLKQAAPKQYDVAAEQGDVYFYIPVLGRHRGVTHFYLENYFSTDFDQDLELAKTVGEVAIDTYCDIFSSALTTRQTVTIDNRNRQLDYHTLYFFQVLTLDRGTTSGLLVHDQNDVGILASLPSTINRALLASWVSKMPSPQNELLQQIVACLPEGDICRVEDDTKRALANCLRQHYRKYPEAINMQASGFVIPSTVNNHR